MLSLNARQRMKTYYYVSSAHITTASNPSLVMHELREAVIVHVPLHAELTWLEPLHSNPGLSFSICKEFRRTGISPPICRYMSASSIRSLGTLSSWLYCRITASTSSTVSLIVSQICSAVVCLDHHPAEFAQHS